MTKAKAILAYIEDGTIGDDPFVQELAAEVERVKNNEKWRGFYMTQRMYIQDERRDERRKATYEKAVKVAKKLLSLGIPLEIVVQASELPLDVVKGLKMG